MAIEMLFSVARQNQLNEEVKLTECLMTKRKIVNQL